MEALVEKYRQLVQQEDTYSKQLRTAEMCTLAMYDHIFQYGEYVEKLLMEEVLLAVHQIEANVRLELLHLRMEKAFLACDMKASR